MFKILIRNFIHKSKTPTFSKLIQLLQVISIFKFYRFNHFIKLNDSLLNIKREIYSFI